MSAVRCPGCQQPINPDDTLHVTPGEVWHLGCRDTYLRRERQREISAQQCIKYMITPQRFILDIPVEALASLSQDAHTRILAMLNAWIVEHKPASVKGPTP